MRLTGRQDPGQVDCAAPGLKGTGAACAIDSQFWPLLQSSGLTPLLLGGRTLLPIVQGGMGIGVSAHRLAGTSASLGRGRHHLVDRPASPASRPDGADKRTDTGPASPDDDRAGQFDCARSGNPGRARACKRQWPACRERHARCIAVPGLRVALTGIRNRCSGGRRRPAARSSGPDPRLSAGAVDSDTFRSPCDPAGRAALGKARPPPGCHRRRTPTARRRADWVRRKSRTSVMRVSTSRT